MRKLIVILVLAFSLVLIGNSTSFSMWSRDCSKQYTIHKYWWYSDKDRRQVEKDALNLKCSEQYSMADYGNGKGYIEMKEYYILRNN